MNAKPIAGALLVLALGACQGTPPVIDAEVPDNTLSGTVIVAVPPPSVNGLRQRGPVMVFVSDAADPMPPLGTGRPLTFAVIQQDAFSDEVSGTPSAPYTITGLPDAPEAGWMITAVMDLDHNFQPLADAFAGATCGDVLGAHVADLVGSAPTPVSVSGGRRLEDVTVVLGQQLHTARPAFAIVDGAVLDRTQATAQALRVVTAPIHAQLGELALDVPGQRNGEPCEPGFLVEVRDADGDGQPDRHPDYGLMGLLDIAPRFALTFLGALVDNGQGPPVIDASVLAPGEQWLSAVVVSPELVGAGELPPVGEPGLASALDLVWVPAGLHRFADGTADRVTDARELPAGAWALTVIEDSGQTWTVPNELGRATATSPSFDPEAQALFVTMR